MEVPDKASLRQISGGGGHPAKLDRHHPLPLWAQLLNDLRRRLASGEFTSRFPTDAELVETYSVSRQTVREAVRRLTADGLLDRRQGQGTVVRSPEFRQPLGSLYSLFRVIEAEGVPQTSIVSVLDEREESEIAKQLDLEPASRLVYLERVRLAGGRPLALDRAWLPADIARPLLGADFSRTALYDELAKLCGIQLTGGSEQIRPVVPTPAERALLQMGRGEAAFAIERRTFVGDRAAEYRCSIVRGDRYGFVAEWEAGDLSRASELYGPVLMPLSPRVQAG